MKTRTAVVTGAARGLGRAIAVRLAKAGAAVSVWDLQSEGVEETAEIIRNASGRAIACAANAASAADIAAATARTRAELGPITVLVNTPRFRHSPPLRRSPSGCGITSWPST